MRLPALSAAGRGWLTLSMVLLIIGSGTGSWMLTGCGFLVLVALLALYLRFIPVAVVLWRRYLELSWWVERSREEGGLICGRPFSLQVTLRNLGPLSLGRAELRLLTSSSIEVKGAAPPLPLPARSEVKTSLVLDAAQAGEWFVHGATIRLHDSMGLCHVEAYFPLPTAIKALPRHSGRAALPPLRLSTGAPDERLGVHTMRHRGLGGELRELREYVPGDPFKLIAWKASARMQKGRLLVRDLDRETLVSHHLVLDVGASMRQGQPGSWKLDHAVSLCESYARAVLEGGDSVGLLTCDGEIFSHSRPGGGPVHRMRLTEQLLRVMQIVDERFCGVSDAELCVQVARYLRQQEGLETKVTRPPPIDDARAWQRLQVAPGGAELYDLGKLAAAAQRILGSTAFSDTQALRQLCLRRGIELPYRGAAIYDMSRRTPRAAGLCEALLRLSPYRGGRIVLLSDLSGLLCDLPALSRATAACRRRGLTLLCLFPTALRYLSRDLLQRNKAGRAAEIFNWEIARTEAQAQAALSRLGFHVVPMGPEDGLAQLLLRLETKRSRQIDLQNSGSMPRTETRPAAEERA